MAALSFLLKGRRDVSVAYYDHGTSHGQEAHKFVQGKCNELGLEFTSASCLTPPPPKISKEEFWRNKRYEFFEKIREPIITAHHLDDAVEWWIFSSLRGHPSLMPVERHTPNVLRPFLFASKKELHRQRDIDYIQDPSNKDLKFARNFIRHELQPLCLNVKSPLPFSLTFFFI